MRSPILTLTHMFFRKNGRFSILSDSGSLLLWIMERTWDMNAPGTGIPRDEYTIEKHNGNKYQNTYALIGDGVGHYPGEDEKPRFACVIHEAVFPEDLEGCFAPALSIAPIGMTIESGEATRQLLEYLGQYETGTIKILCQ